jgi:chromosome segregation ATPase
VKEGQCIMGEMRKDRESKPYKADEDYKKLLEKAAKDSKAAWEKEHDMKTKLSETEVILNGTKMIVEDGFKKIQQMQKELARVKQENNDSFNRIAELCEVNERHQEINGKLQVHLTEVEEENKKMHEHLNKQVENARKSGM